MFITFNYNGVKRFSCGLGDLLELIRNYIQIIYLLKIYIYIYTYGYCVNVNFLYIIVIIMRFSNAVSDFGLCINTND